MRKVVISIIPIMTLSLLVTILTSKNKTKEIVSLNNKIQSQELFIEKIYKETDYQNVKSLYMEIMDLGAKLDSMKLIYDY